MNCSEVSPKILVVIPTYNNSSTLKNIIERVLKFHTDILVVDDGSTDETTSITRMFSNILVTRHKLNKGKGTALATAFQFAKSSNYTHCISIDSDGQHFPEDIPNFLNSIKLNPECLWIGDRNFNRQKTQNVPFSSIFGRWFSNFWVWIETGTWLIDSQSGYRGYPICKIDLQSLKKKNFDFEIEVLVNYLWSGVQVKSQPISCTYAKKAERISHFKPLKDNLRLTLLHTQLVCHKIWRTFTK